MIHSFGCFENTPVLFLSRDSTVLLSLDLLRHLAENSVINLIRQVNRFFYGVPRGNHADIYLPFPRKPQPGNDAGSQVDQGPVDARH
jgi:hypothetical protein